MGIKVLEQLTLDLGVYRRHYKPVKGPACPCCKQNITTQEQILVSWKEFREWLYVNWDWAAKYMLTHLVHNPRQLSLAEHPDLLWALEAEAGDQELELNDCLAEILDGYFQGHTDALKRRGKKLVLKQNEQNKKKQSRQQNATGKADAGAKADPIDLLPYAWRGEYFMAALPADMPAENIRLLFEYSNTVSEERPAAVLGEMIVLPRPWPCPDRVRLALC